MRKAQDYVLQQRRTRYTRYDRESLRKPSKKKDTAKKTKEETEKEGNTAKKTKSKGGKDWADEEISLLIDMLEEKPCLWDLFDKEYTKWDAREKAYTEIASSLDTNIESIKAKINGLRAQHRREVAKVNSGVVRVQINKSYYRISR